MKITGIRVAGRQWSTENIVLAVIVVTFVALSLVYNVVNPVFEAPDELWHFLNVKHIHDKHALIVQSSNALENPARQEGGQPPLYYLASALVTSWIDTGPMEDVAVLNFRGQPGEIGARINKNVVVHRQEEDFPYRGVSLAVHLLRLFSTLLSVGTILATYAIAMEVFPRAREIWLAAAAFNALVPQFIFISSSINNDNLITLVASLAILCLVKLAKGDASRRNLFALSVLISMASISKVSGLGLLPLSAVVLAGVAIRRRSVALALRGLMAVCTGVALLGLWWYARNWSLYGDPLGLSVFLRAVDRGGVKAGLSFSNMDTTVTSFWALFGWSNIVADSMVYWFYNGIVALAGLGLVFCLISRTRGQRRIESYALAIPIAWAAVMVLSLLAWANVAGSDVGRLVFPAISGISIIVSVGIVSLVKGGEGVPQRAAWRRSGFGVAFAVVAAVGAIMLVLAAAMPILYIRSTYKQGTQFVSDIRATTRALNVTFGDKLMLLGYELSKEIVSPGDSVRVMLYWKALPGLDEKEYDVFVHSFPQDQWRSLDEVDDLLSRDRSALELKGKGSLLRQTYDLKIPVDAPSRTRIRLVVGVYDVQLDRLQAYDGIMRPIGSEVQIAELKMADN